MPGAPFKLRWGGWLNRRRIGDRGEALALGYLLKEGYALVERKLLGSRPPISGEPRGAVRPTRQRHKPA